MSLLLFDHIHTARHSLSRNRLRTLLTTLGIAIGIGSVSAILALAEGVTNSVAEQVSEIGGNVAVVRPGHKDVHERVINPLAMQRYNTSTLRESDIGLIRNSQPGLSVAPIMTLEGTLRAGKEAVSDATIVATNEDLPKTTKLPIEDGQFIEEGSSSAWATIGQQLSIDLFGEENSVGNTFELRGKTFTVVGIFKRINDPVNYNGIDFDNAAVISLDYGKQIHGGDAHIQQINIAASSSGDLSKATTLIDEALAKTHGEEDFTIITGRDIASPTNQLFEMLTAVMTAIAAISLVVGGIGIMNIMLVGVAERTREIGIRKSVGASNRAILMQFLVESLMMSLMGGLMGIMLGAISAFVIGRALFLNPVFNWSIALVAFGLAIVVGVIFGVYPAVRAARKDPIESLRQYR
jgi:putative ABC transport system permease protein